MYSKASTLREQLPMLTENRYDDRITLIAARRATPPASSNSRHRPKPWRVTFGRPKQRRKALIAALVRKRKGV